MFGAGAAARGPGSPWSEDDDGGEALAPHVAGEVGHDLGDHQFRLFNGAQLLPIDDDRNVAGSVTEPGFENIRHDHLETRDQSVTRRCLGRDPALCAGRDPHPCVGIVQRVEG